VTRALRDAVAGAAPGARLPSVRELMAEHRAGPGTVQQALARLAEEGLVVPRPGRGTFVAERPADAGGEGDLGWQALALGDRAVDAAVLHDHLALPPPGAIALSSGYPDASLLPAGLLAAALARAARRTGAWERVPTEGLERLRAWFARESGGRFTAHDVVVTPGAQAGLATALRSLAPAGAAVLVESPTYLGAIAAARAAGLRVVPVPTDGDGLRTDLLPAAFAATGARVLFTQPTYANPTGATLPPGRRAALLEAARTAGAFVIEDDWSRDLAVDERPPPPLAAGDVDGHVVLLRSLTKSASSGLRVGALAARGPAGARLRAARVVDDFQVSGLLQDAALDVVSAPGWRRHRRAVAEELRGRRDALAAAVARHLPGAVARVPRGGLFLWVALPEGTDDTALATAAAARGVVVSPGRPWFPAEPPGPFLRLSFAGAPAPDLARGVRLLGEVLAGR